MKSHFWKAWIVGAALLPSLAGAQVDFSRYVALGDSLTAGFASGGLAISSQQGSYPLWIHVQATGNSSFEQPLVSDPGLPPQLKLKSLSPLQIVPKSGTGNPLNLFLPRPYDNLGVPGANVHDTLATVTDNGGLHDLILRGLGTALQQGLALHPTIVTLWIGNNDVLGAAVSGVAIEGVTLTPPAQFEADYRAVAGAILASGAKLVVATIPNVTAIPYVTTIPPIVVNPATQQPVLINGQPVPLIGPDGPLTAADRVLLSAQTELAQGKGIPVQLGGSGEPLSTSSVLSAAEQATILSHAAAFNAVIRSVGSQSGAALVDTEAVLNDIAKNGLSLGGIQITSDFLTGGVFSYDGVHPTPFGYAYIANQFIDVINRKFGSSVKPVNLRRVLHGGGAQQAAVSAAQAQGAVFSDRAEANLRWVLRIPSKEYLESLDPGDGGGGGGGTGGDGGGAGGGHGDHGGAHDHGDGGGR